MLTDPIAQFLTKLKNASRGRRGEVVMQSSKLIRALTELLAAKRFIDRFEEGEDKNQRPELKIFLRADREPLEVKRVSKPGQRIYVGFQGVRRVRNGLGIAIVSTSQGIMGGEEARAKKIGGEYLCEIY